MVVALLRRLDKVKNATDTDGTAYGVHSTRESFGHHAAAISIAIVFGEAEAIVQGICRAPRTGVRPACIGQADGGATGRRSAAKCRSAPAAE
eukprot:7015616-Prymnesium_polylepis.1